MNEYDSAKMAEVLAEHYPIEKTDNVHEKYIQSHRDDLKRIAVAGAMTAQMMGFAFGIIASLIVDVFPTAKIIIKVLMMPLYFLSGIMYPFWIVPSQYLHYLQYNPILHLIELLRESYFSHYPVVNGISLLYPLIVTVVALFIALYFYRFRRFALAAKP